MGVCVINILLDKLAVLGLCTFALVSQGSFTLPVVCLLISLTLSALCQCFPKSRCSMVFQGIHIILAVIFPIFCCTLPLTLYDILYDKRYIASGLIAVPLIVNFDSFTYTQIALYAVNSLVAVLLSLRTSKLEGLEEDIIKLRDTSQENAMLLEQKNRSISEKQNYEIHLATLRERNRIAREIHDNVGHLLTRSLLQMGALSVMNKDNDQHEYIEGIRQTLDNAMTTIRQSVHNLHDESIDFKGAVKEITSGIPRKYKLSLSLDVSENMPSDIKLAFIGVIKEAVSNIERHSNGDAIDIIVREHPAFYQLAINDNGVCHGEIQDSGIGLSNMRNRIEGINGIITFTPSENGFRVFASVQKKFEGEA